MRDFTLSRYRELCTRILDGHVPVTVREHLEKKGRSPLAILRHDVDARPLNALEMAKIENDMGISSTYYFRTSPNVFKPEIIGEIHDMGHEIGYHYEVMDKEKGNPERAMKLFERELKEFPCEIQTIAMHGNPLTPYTNYDLWDHYDFEDYGILGEAYLSIDYSNLRYFSDTGRAWNNKYSIKDITSSKNSNGVNSTRDMINFIIGNKIDICIATHPQRWHDSISPWFRELVFQSVKNVPKAVIKKCRGV